jgi:hypothetical protein
MLRGRRLTFKTRDTSHVRTQWRRINIYVEEGSGATLARGHSPKVTEKADYE